MIKKRVTYTDLNGVKKSRDCYFHLYENEVRRLNAQSQGEYITKLQDMQIQNDHHASYVFIEDAILMAYGEPSANGDSFKKSPAITAEFKDSVAFNSMMDSFIDELVQAKDGNKTQLVKFMKRLFDFNGKGVKISKENNVAEIAEPKEEVVEPAEVVE